MKIKPIKAGKQVRNSATSIVKLLEAGKPVKGKFAWVQIANEETYWDDSKVKVTTPVFAKVKIIGLVQSDNGMVIKATLTDGLGTLTVEPDALVTSLPEVEKIIDIAKRQSLAINQNKHIKNAHFKREQIRRLEEAIDKLPPKVRKELREDKVDYFTQGEIPKVKASLASADLNTLSKLVCLLAHNLDPGQSPDSYDWRD